MASDPRFPPIEPHETGLLDTGDGHRVYWEISGNPGGIPALYLHGGPGSGASPGQRRFFDPSLYRTVIFDQRGSGRSAPLAERPDADLETNTTTHLIADIESLREMLGVDRWVILGLSWGTTLALAYAQAHSEHVRGLVLGLVTTGSRSEIDWITEGVGRIFPHEWEQFVEAIPPPLRHLRPVEAYAHLTRDPEPAVHGPAAAAWCAWEDAHVSLAPGHQPNPAFGDPDFRLRFARLVTHYWSNDCFLGDDQLLRGAGVLDGIPGELIHGRYDVSSPLETAWRLSKAWKTSSLTVLEDEGHGGIGLVRSVVDGLNGLAVA